MIMKQGWEYKKLGDICDIYQPKTLSSSELIEDGAYLVYGANGVIGKYDKYNHEESEVLLTCRGATCGTINVSEPFSWINGNAMVVHPKKEELSQVFLKYYLSAYDMSHVITGAAQPQITRQSLTPVLIPVPPLTTQQSIVSELDSLSQIIADYKAQLEDFDKLEQSIFYDMFGDPVKNEKGWEVKTVDDIATLNKGITYSPTDVVDEGGTIVLRSGNIKGNQFDLSDIVRVSKNINPSKFVHENEILMCNRNGSAHLVGKVALIPKLNEEVSFGTFMTIIQSEMYNYLYHYFQTRSFRKQIEFRTAIAINQISLPLLASVTLPVPPLPLQKQFSDKITAIEQMKSDTKAALQDAELLFNSRMDYWFN